jgi:hypothetical protein
MPLHPPGGAYWGGGYTGEADPLTGMAPFTPYSGAQVGSTLAGLLEQDPLGARTPGMDWADLMRNVGRTWAERGPLSQMRNQLESRYQLSSPVGGFAEFLGGYNPLTPAALRLRAQEALRVGQMTEDQATTYALQQGPAESDPWLRAISLRGFFDPLASGGTQNQMAVANLLSQQRPERLDPTTGTQIRPAGQWQGRMSQNIQNAMTSMYNQRFGQGYAPDTFLDWYLQQTA